MSLNAALSIGKNTDKIVHIIQRECTKATEWWRREYEGQQRYIKNIHDLYLKAQVAGKAAVLEANKAKEEADRCRAELERYKAQVKGEAAGERSDWKAEAQRYKAEAETWKKKYELAARGRDDAKQQLAKTQARFSLTVVPLSPPSESFAGMKRPADVPIDPEKDVGKASSSSPPGSKRRRYPTTIQFPTPAVAAGLPLSSKAVDSAMSGITSLDIPLQGSSSLQASSSTLEPQPQSVNPLDTQINRAPTSTSGQSTSESMKKWCYCDCYEYGKMVMCSNPNCSKQWFHIPCTGLKQIPEGDWWCKNCHSSLPPHATEPVPLDTPTHWQPTTIS